MAWRVRPSVQKSLGRNVMSSVCPLVKSGRGVCGRRQTLQTSCQAVYTSAPRRQTTLNSPLLQRSTAGLRAIRHDELNVDAPIAYEIYQGALARWSHDAHPSGNPPPTAVLVHGILGNRKNMSNFAKMLVEGFPSWQVVLVDLRCHGESAARAAYASGVQGVHTLHDAATDVLQLLRQLRLFPRVLIGHSFGGKVVMSMVQQFPGKLPRPVQVWVLDSLPGEVRAGGGPQGSSDHPGTLIELLRSMPMPVAHRNDVMDAVMRAGFSQQVARWVVTNLRPVGDGQLGWTFDLDGIAQLYRSYEETQLWDLVQNPPQGLKLDFVKAERSTFRWATADEQLIEQGGHAVHLLRNAGHWVHTDNPLGLYEILAPSFGGSSDIKQWRSAQAMASMSA